MALCLIETLCELPKTVTEIVALLRRIDRNVARLALQSPSRLTVTLIREDDQMLRYRANWTTSPSPDVSQQTLVIENVTDATSESQSLDAAATFAEFLVPQDKEITLRLTATDDAGNVSAAIEETFTSLDTIPPDAPGGFGEITLLGEE